MPYIFIISCIRLSCSERVIIEDTDASFNFSTFIFILSLLRAFLKAAVRASVVSFNSSSLVSSLNISERSVSILANLSPSFLPSRCVMNGWSILCVRMIASIFSFLNILIYWLCSFSSVT